MQRRRGRLPAPDCRSRRSKKDCWRARKLRRLSSLSSSAFRNTTNTCTARCVSNEPAFSASPRAGALENASSRSTWSCEIPLQEGTRGTAATSFPAAYRRCSCHSSDASSVFSGAMEFSTANDALRRDAPSTLWHKSSSTPFTTLHFPLAGGPERLD
eukprot:scaffold1014_cov260-Pinguiococcus_pyrenoidosus.AAC.4